MDEQSGSDSIQFGDQLKSDIHVRLKNNKGRQELFRSHSSILKNKSTYFADKLSDQSSHSCLEIQCTELDYDHYVKLLKCLYLPTNSLLDSWDSVKSALGVLEVAKKLHCESIFESCVEYLEAVPWEDSEEDNIVRVVSKLGPTAMPILARIQPVELGPIKNVFISAIRFATSLDSPFPPFGDELKTSAQEQVEYMLGDDEDMHLATSDNEVKTETQIGLFKTFSFFEKELSSISESNASFCSSKILQSLSDLEWLCNILLKMGLMTDFVSKWIEISENILRIIDDKKIENKMWDLKVKLIEVTSKVLDAVGYGNVIIPAPQRVQLLKSWLPFIRKLKPVLDLMIKNDKEFPYKMDDDLCQSIEGAIVSLVLALPSDDQAEILADWMNAEQQVRYPDLSEAFELWCFRTKSAKRRLVGGLDNKIDNATVSL
ncbi:hypothetical protein ACJIZ3_003789 [Penstemon smallii]|uniref:BTB domain-containing protein n=1 Tax=Penstemon smallii TaxID=265156 RepID=A0ABD3S066_9LAMI